MGWPLQPLGSRLTGAAVSTIPLESSSCRRHGVVQDSGSVMLKRDAFSDRTSSLREVHDYHVHHCHGNPQPSFLGVIYHMLGVQNLHFSWFWGLMVFNEKILGGGFTCF